MIGESKGKFFSSSIEFSQSGDYSGDVFQSLTTKETDGEKVKIKEQTARYNSEGKLISSNENCKEEELSEEERAQLEVSKRECLCGLYDDDEFEPFMTMLAPMLGFGMMNPFIPLGPSKSPLIPLSPSRQLPLDRPGKEEKADAKKALALEKKPEAEDSSLSKKDDEASQAEYEKGCINIALQRRVGFSEDTIFKFLSGYDHLKINPEDTDSEAGAKAMAAERFLARKESEERAKKIGTKLAHEEFMQKLAEASRKAKEMQAKRRGLQAQAETERKAVQAGRRGVQSQNERINPSEVSGIVSKPIEERLKSINNHLKNLELQLSNSKDEKERGRLQYAIKAIKDRRDELVNDDRNAKAKAHVMLKESELDGANGVNANGRRRLQRSNSLSDLNSSRRPAGAKDRFHTI